VSTGKAARGSADEPFYGELVGVTFRKSFLVAQLDDGREIAVPMAMYPTLLGASSKQRGNWRVIGPGKGVHWPDLDLDLSLRGILLGLPERIPAPPEGAAASAGARSSARPAASKRVRRAG